MASKSATLSISRPSITQSTRNCGKPTARPGGVDRGRPEPRLGDSYGTDLFNFNGTLYFETSDGSHYTVYKTDGTAAGTSAAFQVQSAVPIYGPQLSPNFTAVGNQLYFFGYDATGHWALYRTDGTAAGTAQIQTLAGSVQVVEIGGAYFLAPVASMTNLDGTLYFRDTSLWKVDADGHTELIDASANPVASGAGLYAVDHHLYYTATNASESNQIDLWESDGTAAGTTVLRANVGNVSRANVGDVSLYPLGKYLYFVTGLRLQEQL